jgi:hypothetical protein
VASEPAFDDEVFASFVFSPTLSSCLRLSPRSSACDNDVNAVHPKAGQKPVREDIGGLQQIFVDETELFDVRVVFLML